MQPTKTASTLLVLIAFATVYIVWGSTYFFIQMAVKGFPPFLLGALRFLVAGGLMLGWSALKGEKLWVWENVKHAAVVGTLLLFVAIGFVIWVEQLLPSGMVAILVSSSPMWFIVLDRKKWNSNFRDKATILGLLIGFAGVLLLFGEQFMQGVAQSGTSHLPAMLLLIVGTIAWSAGSLYSKYHPTTGSAPVNTGWQMLVAGLLFLPCSFIRGEVQNMQWQLIPGSAIAAMLYLIVFGSIAAFSAYIWLLQVRPATQVSTYAYVNPVIAVILGLCFGHEHISLLQIGGLIVILGSVLLINLNKYRQAKVSKPTTDVAFKTPALE